MSFFRDFLNLWHEWAAVDDMDDDDQTGHFGNFGHTDDENDFGTFFMDGGAPGESFGEFMEDDESTEINPATGLPMLGGIDAGGNPYGTDLNDHPSWDNDHYGITSGSDSDPW